VSDAPWPAPAKLNLFLHVTGRRPDGYHELQTLFQLVDLADTLTIRRRTDGRIRRSGSPLGIPDQKDLAVRAAEILRSNAGNVGLGADIVVEKRIPIGSGMGGGSSDAATVLVALNELWGLHWPLDRLAALGVRLGADVPVFVHGRSALAGGVGERLEPAAIGPAHFAVVFPGVASLTAEAFQAPELTRNSPAITIAGFLSSDWPRRALAGRNDLEPVVATRLPAVRAALAWLGARGEARLTGSGAALFAPFAERAAAQAALAGLPAEWTGFVVSGLAESPLAARAAAERS
jgi:4-diphosphocytidyl-2-C-methyl-D-erythritol kinase